MNVYTRKSAESICSNIRTLQVYWTFQTVVCMSVDCISLFVFISIAMCIGYCSCFVYQLLYWYVGCTGHWAVLHVLLLSERMFTTVLSAALIHMIMWNWKLQSMLLHSLLQSQSMSKYVFLFTVVQHIDFITPHAVLNWFDTALNLTFN